MPATELAPPPSHRRELRRYQYGAVLLAGMSLVLGALLIPRGDELLLIHVKHRDLDRARAMLAGAADRGVSTAASVVAHNELYLLEGRVDEALTELEAYTAGRPEDVEAWTRLARMYADAQRLDDQARAVAHIYERAPSSEVARRLIALRRWNGDEAGEAVVLADLVETGAATTEEHLRGARLAAAIGRSDTALRLLDLLRRRSPAALDYPALELYASVVVDTEGPAGLAVRMEPLPLVHTNPDVLVALAGTLTSWGRTDAAIALFDAPGGGTPPPSRLAMRARVAKGTALAAATAAALVAWDAATPFAAEPLAALVELLLSIGDDEMTAAVLGHPARTADPQLVGLAVGQMLARGNRAGAQALIVRHGDAGLEDSPVLALDLALDRKDLAAAERWIHAVDAAGPSPEEVALLAQAEQRLGHPERAYARLMELARAGTAPAWALTDFARLSIETGRTDHALAVLASVRVPEAEAAWARLAASTGRAGALDPWLDSPGARRASPDTLRDVYYGLADAAQTSLAVKAAELLYANEPTAANALLLGHALLAAERPIDALRPLRLTDPSAPDAVRTYATALVSGLSAGMDVHAEARVVLTTALRDPRTRDLDRSLYVEGLWLAGERASLVDELIALAVRDLERWLPWLIEASAAAGRRDGAMALVTARLERTPVSAREPLVRALVDLDAPDAVLLPHLRQMAETQGDSWVYAYDERLARGAYMAERVALWSSVGRSPTTNSDLRRGAASRLVELGAKEAAAETLQSLVEQAGPDDPDLQQLLWLWGPQAGDRPVAWLIARLHERPMDERAAWIEHAVRAGGARPVVAAMPCLPAGASSALVGTWLAAWEAAGSVPTLRQALQQVLLSPTHADADLRVAGRMALAHEQVDLAWDAFALLAGRAPFDPEALRWLGTLAFYEGRTEPARTWLARYVAVGGTDGEPFYQLGELALLGGDPPAAHGWFLRAAAALESNAAATAALRANTLVRLDERARARAAFEALLARDPTVDHVRADYVVALLQWDDYEHARQVLDARPATGVSPAADRTSGARRLDLLRVQWLVHQGQFGGALQVLESLTARFPTDADVLLARARFDEERGRPSVAARWYAEAGRQAPRRSDIERLLDTRAREQAPQAGFESEVRSISGGWDERWVRAAASTRNTPDATVAMLVERLRLSGGLVKRGDGRIAPVDTDVLRFDLSATRRVGAATVLAGALFGTPDGLGVGARVVHDDLRGRTEAIAEVGRPFWEFLETATDDGRRDRLGVDRRWRFRPDTAGWVYGGWHRYRIASDARTDSVAISAGLVHTVRQARPVLTLQYGLDKEQRVDATVAMTADGDRFMPIPLASREVHLFGAVSRAVIGRGWEIEGSGGYTLDRLGGRGGFFTARLTPPPSSRIGLEVWADQRLFVLATSQHVFRAGARVRVRWQP